MTLVDTSVWVDHLRSGNRTLASLLERGEVLTHPFVIGELACGQIRNRREVLALLAALPGVIVASHEDVLGLIEAHRLAGRGIGWVDAHMLASCVLSHVPLATLDTPLQRAATLVASRPDQRPDPPAFGFDRIARYPSDTIIAQGPTPHARSRTCRDQAVFPQLS